MKVSTRVHYGLRAMTELARSYRDDRLLSISEIARNEDLPLAYLEQLVGELRRAGLVEGTRGVRGGYRLARAPEDDHRRRRLSHPRRRSGPGRVHRRGLPPGTCAREAMCLSRNIWERVQVGHPAACSTRPPSTTC